MIARDRARKGMATLAAAERPRRRWRWRRPGWIGSGVEGVAIGLALVGLVLLGEILTHWGL